MALERFAPRPACLAEKGLAYEGHEVDMAKMEHHLPEYLKINPLGVIPRRMRRPKETPTRRGVVD
ncbi:hypothetical protein [Bradyrhizobium algeriense]|uniref:hypothetical protein n=1 Tax=Bradyrhizobium algeriense TaxID=634784 RepID=UPI00237C1B1C|nr:hypothetical protein [Bradyrhizobium algeriense]